PAQCAGKLTKGCITTRLQQLVSLDSELRNLPRACQLWNAAPITVAAQGIDVGKNPACNNEVRRLARQAQQVKPHSHAISFQANQQLLGYGNLFTVRVGVWPADYSLYKRRRNSGGKLPLRQEETQPRLLNPRPGILQGEGPMSVQAHPFGARCFQLFRCQRKTSLPGWLLSRAAPSPKRGAVPPSTTFQIRWKARWISFQEYSKAIGRPCGQLVGWRVFANSKSNHSIRAGSRGVLTLMAERQA